jgi:hypothetical protein
MQNPDGSLRMNAYGQPMYKMPTMQKPDEDAIAEHRTEGPKTFEQARNMYSGLTQMQAAESDLAARGGFTTSGFMGELRGQMSTLAQTLSDMGIVTLDKDKALAIRNMDLGEINKWRGTLIFNLKNSLDPGARSLGSLMEAATTVPGLNNTPLQFMVLTAGLKGLAAWKAGEFSYKDQYLQNAGTLYGADSAYGRATSPLDETRAELAKIGMQITPDNHFKFINDQAIQHAFANGLLGPRTEETLNKVYSSEMLGAVKSDRAREIYKRMYNDIEK